VVADATGRVVGELAEGIGRATNNVAEYRAAVEGLRLAARHGARQVVLRSDSRLLIEQLAGRFRVKHPTLQRFHEEARREMRRFDEVRLEHVRRERNAEADRLANEGIDAWLATGDADLPEGPSSPQLF
jgi:ribonuclease HI